MRKLPELHVVREPYAVERNVIYLSSIRARRAPWRARLRRMKDRDRSGSGKTG